MFQNTNVKFSFMLPILVYLSCIKLSVAHAQGGLGGVGGSWGGAGGAGTWPNVGGHGGAGGVGMPGSEYSYGYAGMDSRGPYGGAGGNGGYYVSGTDDQGRMFSYGGGAGGAGGHYGQPGQPGYNSRGYYDGYGYRNSAKPCISNSWGVLLATTLAASFLLRI